MAYQLWTSPITGYRRTGTRLSDVRALFESGITTKAIFEPLKSCPADQDVVPIAETMRMRDFDVLGILESKEGPVIGYVLRSDLISGKVKDHIKIITPEILVAESAPIAELFQLLCENKFLFVLNRTKVEGIVTQADLNKPSVRVYLFGLISLLEMHMGFWVRNHYNDSWENEISDKRLDDAKALFEKRKEKNQAIDLFECLQFCDKRDLLLKPKELRDKLSIESKSKGKSILEQAEQLRNSLAHSQQDISQGVGWNAIFDAVSWLEEFLTSSDQSIEESAKEASEGFDDNLL